MTMLDETLDTADDSYDGYNGSPVPQPVGLATWLRAHPLPLTLTLCTLLIVLGFLILGAPSAGAAGGCGGG